MAYRPNPEEMDDNQVAADISRFMETACADDPAPAQQAQPQPQPRPAPQRPANPRPAAKRRPKR